MSEDRKKCGIGWFKTKDEKKFLILVINRKRYAMFDNQIDENRNKFDYILYESAPKDQRGTGKQGIGWKLNVPEKFSAVIKIGKEQYFITTNKLKSDSNRFDVIVYPYVDKRK